MVLQSNARVLVRMKSISDSQRDWSIIEFPTYRIAPQNEIVPQILRYRSWVKNYVHINRIFDSEWASVTIQPKGSQKIRQKYV